ncbi:hypothetical protein B0H19DRAFT_1151123, partial [Mycena capillaripes]
MVGWRADVMWGAILTLGAMRVHLYAYRCPVLDPLHSVSHLTYVRAVFLRCSRGSSHHLDMDTCLVLGRPESRLQCLLVAESDDISGA